MQEENNVIQDTWGRTINYLRISITDRCNMSCLYCMPYPVQKLRHEEILWYEEYLLVCQAAVSLGVNRFKITGGEPFMRKDAISFMAALRALEGVQSVTVTTNGYELEKVLPDLKAAHIDGINISLDTLDSLQYCRIAGIDGCVKVVSAIKACVHSGLHTKINALLLEETERQIIPLAEMLERIPADLRFIEIMPIGYGRQHAGISADTAMHILWQRYPDLHPVAGEPGDNGPALYFKSDALLGRIGIIAANSHRFCSTCNRIRLTSTGLLKPCLCYDKAVDLREILRSNRPSLKEELKQAFRQAAAAKPQGHCFGDEKNITEDKPMNQIGG